MKTKLLLLGLLFALQSLYSSTIDDFTTTAIPDANFEQALLDLGIDSDGVVNGQVLTSDINTITSLDLTDPLNNTNLPNVIARISDLTGIEDFLALETLSIDDNLVSSIDLSFNTSLHTLTCVNNALTALDVSANLLLKTIILDNNQVSVLNVNGNTLLENLSFTLNNVSILNVNNNTALKYLAFGRNQINTIDVSLNPNLETLFCDNNGITSIDVSSNTKLSSLGIQNNQISALDVSANTLLVQLFCSFNQLTSLNIANGNNNSLAIFNSTGNATLNCIKADATTPINGLTGWSKDMQHIFSSSCAQTYVPDDNLETYLETHDANGNPVAIGDPTSMGNGRPLDDYVFTNRINTVRKLEVLSLSIVLMTGIQDFAALEHLNCFDNNIGTLDLSSNTNLNYVKCDSNQITSLDVTNSPNLNFLACNVNQLPSLNVTQNPNLTILDCDTNQITNLDVTNNPVLHTLDAQGNLLTSLNTSQNPLLFTLVCSSNQIPTIDVTSNTKLNALNCSDNLLTSLNLNLNLDLQILGLSKNSISTLDLTNNLKLEILAMAENLFSQIDIQLNSQIYNFTANNNPNLSSLNIANGNNASFTFLQIVNNPLLTCITADAATPATGLTGWNKDYQHTFSVACASQQLTYVPDDNFEQYLIGRGYDSGPLDDHVPTANINTLTSLVMNYRSISDLTGIEDFKDLKILKLEGNLLADPDLSKNLMLEELILNSNPLTNLDITKNIHLKVLQTFDCSLGTIDVSRNIDLEVLWLRKSNITAISIDTNINLKDLDIARNPIQNINLINNINLNSLSCSGTNISNIDVSFMPLLTLIDANGMPNLKSLNVRNGNNTSFIVGGFSAKNNPLLMCIQVDDVSFSDTNWSSNKDAQASFNTDCSTVWSVMTSSATTTALLAVTGLDANNDGTITQAEAAAFTGTLDLSGTGIKDVEGLAAFTGITTLDVSGNGITDLSPLTGSSFTTIAKTTGKTKIVQKTTTMALQTLIASNNNFDVLDVSSLSNLTTVDVSNNQALITLNMQNGNNTSITSFNSINTPNLTCIFVDDVNASYLSTWVKDTKSEFVANELDCRARVLNVENLDVSKNVFTFPNPIQSKLNIHLNNSFSLKKVEIYAITGKKVRVSVENIIDFSNLSKGIYLIKIFTNKGVAFKKILKK
ncbi:leucine-rich repeat domain-containing protein [uncultured Polaribacter sp.]|uniref:leucine-rich repeat domain-containing protein n=1 Tax=uncultured Polaribacter sp. TaxID=174711 RepID=UPI00262618B0|nr:leucine-rich repeat domain-containing protein [uncultured Polaribacter sp.]